MRHIAAFIYVDDEGSEVRIPVEDMDGEFSIPPIEQLKGILHAIRYILGTEEGESVLDQCVTVVRRYKLGWPDFKRLTALEQMQGAQICRVGQSGGYVLWWAGGQMKYPPLRESLDEAIRRYEREERDGRPTIERNPSGGADPAGPFGARKYSDGFDTNIPDAAPIRKRGGETGQSEIRSEQRTD